MLTLPETDRKSTPENGWLISFWVSISEQTGSFSECSLSTWNIWHKTWNSQPLKEEIHSDSSWNQSCSDSLGQYSSKTVKQEKHVYVLYRNILQLKGMSISNFPCLFRKQVLRPPLPHLIQHLLPFPKKPRFPPKPNPPWRDVSL